jgi:uncharacterized protein YpuA (DUF1002 family)
MEGNVKKKFLSVITSIMVLSACILQTAAISVQADSGSVKPFIAFGANLSESQKNTVLNQMGITSAELADYETIEVTNAEEHEYLDEYLDASVIGTRALSSVKIEEADAGSGISVEAHNISFCTEEMYTNALVTAGISDADVVVAAPFEISGTAALVGAMKAYGTMTGDEIDSDSADAATNELVLTGELGESLGKDDAAEMVALLKNKVLSGDLSSEDDIMDAIDEAADELDIQLTDEQKQKLLELMEKIIDLDLDIDTLKEQAQGIYDKLADLDINIDEAKGFMEKIVDFLGNLWDKIQNLF